MVNAPEFSFWRMVVRSWVSTWAFFGSWRRDIGIGLFSLVVGEVIFYRSHGLPETWTDSLDNLFHLAAPAVALWALIFVWHFLMAPFAVIFEGQQIIANASNANDQIGVGNATSFSDPEAKRMGGKIIRLGEVNQKPGFKGFQTNSAEEMYFSDIVTSAHVIWSRQDALQLRRNFEDEVVRIIATNKAHDEKARTIAIAELSKTVPSLAAILIAQSR